MSLDMFGSIDEESLKLVFLSTEGSILKEIKVKHSSSNFVAKSALPMEGYFRSYIKSIYKLNENTFTFTNENIQVLI